MLKFSKDDVIIVTEIVLIITQTVSAVFLPAVFFHSSLINYVDNIEKNDRMQQTNVTHLNVKINLSFSTYCPNSFKYLSHLSTTRMVLKLNWASYTPAYIIGNDDTVMMMMMVMVMVALCFQMLSASAGDGWDDEGVDWDTVDMWCHWMELRCWFTTTTLSASAASPANIVHHWKYLTHCPSVWPTRTHAQICKEIPALRRSYHVIWILS